jgi:hypothetical protein
MLGWAYGIFGCVGDGIAGLPWLLEDTILTFDDAGDSGKIVISVRFKDGNMVERSESGDCSPSMWSGSAVAMRDSGPGSL